MSIRSTAAAKRPQVFISYAREDNAVPDDKSAGWVDYFENALRVALLGEGLRDVKLWRDRREIEPGDVPDAEVVKGLETSEVLIPVVSRNFIGKPYPQAELREFVRLLGERGQAQASGHIFKVLSRHVPPEKLDVVIRDARGFVFYRLNADGRVEDDNARYKMFYKLGGRTDDEYWDVMEELAQVLRERLAPASTAVETTSSATARPKVFVAVLEFDAGYRRQLAFELDRTGYEVVPQDDRNTTEAAIRSALRASVVSVHMLSQAGEDGEGSAVNAGRSVERLQLKLAAERSRADPKFRRLIWRPPGFRGCSEDHQRLYDELREGNALFESSDEVVADVFERFKESVLDAVADASPNASTAPPSSESLTAAGEPVTDTNEVVILCRAGGEAAALALQGPIATAGCEPFVSLTTDEEETLPEALLPLLGRCRALIIVLEDDGDEAWVKNVLSRVPHEFERVAPIAIKAVILAGGRTQRKSFFASPNAGFVIDAQTGESDAPAEPEVLEPLLEKLAEPRPT